MVSLASAWIRWSASIAALIVLGVTTAAAGAAAADAPDVRGAIVAGGRPHAGAVIWLEDRAALPQAPRKAVMDQRNLTFEPRVLALRVGTTVEFPNNDRVFHN